MPQHRDDHLRIALVEAAGHLATEPEPFIVLFERGDCSVELYAPRGADKQTTPRSGRSVHRRVGKRHIPSR